MFASGSAPLQKHCSAISQFPRPVDRPSLQQFRGMVNVYRKFICQAAKILHLLTSALKGSPKNFSWDSAIEQSFSDPKLALLQINRLVRPVPSAPISRVVDTSESLVGAVLRQRISAAGCAQALLSKWGSRFGVPSVFTADRGAQFTFSLLKEFCLLLEISHTKTTLFHPQSNGLVKRFHRSLKSSLRSKLAGLG